MPQPYLYPQLGTDHSHWLLNWCQCPSLTNNDRRCHVHLLCKHIWILQTAGQLYGNFIFYNFNHFLIEQLYYMYQQVFVIGKVPFRNKVITVWLLLEYLPRLLHWWELTVLEVPFLQTLVTMESGLDHRIRVSVNCSMQIWSMHQSRGQIM